MSLCNQQFNQEDQLKQHYINVHNVDSNNYFFYETFQTKNYMSEIFTLR